MIYHKEIDEAIDILSKKKSSVMKYKVKSKSTGEYIIEVDYRYLTLAEVTQEQAYELELEYADKLCSNDEDLIKEECK